MLSSPIWTVRYFELMLVTIGVGIGCVVIGLLVVIYGLLKSGDKNNKTSSNDIKYASIPRRAGAAIIDYFLLIVLFAVFINISIPLGILCAETDPHRTNITLPVSGITYSNECTPTVANNKIPVLFIILCPIVYFMLLEGPTGGGKTIGKRIMKIKVVSVDNSGIPSFKQSFIRTLTRCIDLMFSFHVVGLLISFVSEKNQRLGDKLTGTIVVKE